MSPLAFQILRMLEDEDLPGAIICDLDGCLCPMEGREQHLEADDLDAFHKAGYEIDPAPWCLEIIRKFQSNYRIIFVTGRPASEEVPTQAWLEDRCDLADFDLYTNNTDLQDYEFKPQCYTENIQDHYRVLFVIDDRPRVVEAWRALGLLCLQPNFTPG